MDFWWQMFCQFSPGKKKPELKFVTGNFTTFFTARKEICHLELTLGASSPKIHDSDCISRERKLNTNFFFSNFSGTPGMSRQNPRISRQKVWLPWVSKNIPNFLAPTLHVEAPHPTRRFPDQKVWVWVPFASLNIASMIRSAQLPHYPLSHPSALCPSQSAVYPPSALYPSFPRESTAPPTTPSPA